MELPGGVFDQKGGRWSIEANNVYQLCYAWARASLLLDHSHVRKSSERVDLLWLAEYASVETDWTTVKYLAVSRGITVYEEILRELQSDRGGAEGAIGHLASLRQQTREKLMKWQRKQQEAHAINLATIQKMDKNAEGAKMVRDVAASAFIGVATVISGGAFVAALGVGAKGVFKWSDTGSIASLVTEVIVEGAAAAIPFVKGNSSQVLVTLITSALGGTGELVKSCVDGKSIEEGAASAMVKGTAPWMKDFVLTPLFKNSTVPVLEKATASATTEKGVFGGTWSGATKVQQIQAAKNAKGEPHSSSRMAPYAGGYLNQYPIDRLYVERNCIYRFRG